MLCIKIVNKQSLSTCLNWNKNINIIHIIVTMSVPLLNLQNKFCHAFFSTDLYSSILIYNVQFQHNICGSIPLLCLFSNTGISLYNVTSASFVTVTGAYACVFLFIMIYQSVPRSTLAYYQHNLILEAGWKLLVRTRTNILVKWKILVFVQYFVTGILNILFIFRGESVLNTVLKRFFRVCITMHMY